MEKELIFIDEKTGDKVGMHYGSWISVIRGILVKYASKSTDEADIILANKLFSIPKSFGEVLLLSHELDYHWAMLGAYGEGYWLKGIGSVAPDGYFEWYEEYLRSNDLKKPFVWY